MFFAEPFWDHVARGLLLGPLALVWIIFVVRVVGLRSFSKMAPFDFAVTVAIGSLLAMSVTATDWGQFAVRQLGIAALLGTQWLIARGRYRSERFAHIIANSPVILMRDGRFREKAMRASRVTRGDIVAKLREANALDRSSVRAVVLETTGDISVLHGGEPVEPMLLDRLEEDAGLSPR